MEYIKFKDLSVGDLFVLKYQLPRRTVGIGGGRCSVSTTKPIYKKRSNDKRDNSVAINMMDGCRSIGPNRLVKRVKNGQNN